MHLADAPRRGLGASSLSRIPQLNAWRKMCTGDLKSPQLELVNYRVQGSRIVVDRLFSEAELRLRHGRAGTTVRLVRAGGGT